MLFKAFSLPHFKQGGITMVDKKYDSSWDHDNYNEKAWNRKYKQWQSRDWVKWLKAELKFLFQVERMEDDIDIFAPEHICARYQFPAGCKVEVLGIADEDCDVEFEDVIMEIRDKKRKGYIPLQDLEVRPKSDPNYWPVREFAVWYANQ